MGVAFLFPQVGRKIMQHRWAEVCKADVGSMVGIGDVLLQKADDKVVAD